MAEVITETILPGTYIEVRAEGLLTIGAIATGNIGILGTAERGGAEIVSLDSASKGRAVYGGPGTWSASAGYDNLTLVRALQLMFDNGARTVYAKRVLDAPSAAAATYTIQGESAGTLLLQASTPGDWGNQLQVHVEPAEASDLVSDETVARDNNGRYVLSGTHILPPSSPDASIGTVVVRDQGLTQKYQLKTGPASSSTVQVNTSDGSLQFAAAPSGSAEVHASYFVAKDGLRRVTLMYGNVREVYVTPSLRYLAQRIANPLDSSTLVTVKQSAGAGVPKPLERPAAFAGGLNGSVGKGHFQTALDDLVNQDVQIVVVAGGNFSDVKDAVLGHVEKTENLGRERIAVLGADSSEPGKILENANDIADKRVVLVAPGLLVDDADSGRAIALPPWCAAAAVAGKLSSVSPHISLTNKPLAGIERLGRLYDYGELKALVQNRVLAVERKRGFRVVKAISTDDEAFKQISIRRIVDYVKVGTRIGANQYIGKLNNRRVRENLRTTLDSFLADLILREFLTAYKLTVFADRAMEIRGEVLVTMDLNPTFSIDVIRVVMNLS